MAYYDNFKDFSQVMKQLQGVAAQSTCSFQELVQAVGNLAATGAVPLAEVAPEIETAAKRAQYTTLRQEYKTLQSRH